MRRFITLLLLLVLLGAANRSSAQFSISRVTPKEIDTKAMDDTIKPIAPINNRFFQRSPLQSRAPCDPQRAQYRSDQRFGHVQSNRV